MLDEGSRWKTLTLPFCQARLGGGGGAATLGEGSLSPSNSPEHLIHLGELLGHFGVIWSVFVTTVIHTQEMDNK